MFYRVAYKSFSLIDSHGCVQIDVANESKSEFAI